MSGNVEDLTVGLDLEDSGFEGGLRAAEEKVSAAMKRIGAMRAEAEIQADIHDVEEKEKRASAILDKWKAKRASATLDLDTKKTDAYIKGLETKLKNIGNDKTALSVELSERSLTTARELDKISKALGTNTKAQNDFKKASKDSEAALFTWAGKLSDTTVRLGPFTSSIKGAGAALITLAPLVVGVAGALGSLISVVGAGLIGAFGLGGAAAAGFGLTAIGLYGALKPLGAQLKTITTASTAYATAVDKYGESSKQAKTAQDALNSTLQHMSPLARQAFTDLGSMNEQWTKLTAPTRRTALDTLGAGLSTLNTLMPSLAARTNQAAKAIDDGLDKAFAGLSSGNGKTTLDAIFGGFVKALPSILSGFRELASASGHFFAAFAGGPLKGIATDFDQWATGVGKAAGNTSRMARIADETVSAFKAVGSTTEAAGKVLFQFFRGGLGAGMGLTDSISDSLNRLAHNMSTVAGQKSLGTFFSNSAQSAKLLWNAITPLLGTFVNFAAIFSPFANAASQIAKALGDITQAASGIPGVGLALKGAFGYELLRSLPIVGRILPSIGSGLSRLSRASGAEEAISGIGPALTGLGPLGIAAGVGLLAVAGGIAAILSHGDGAARAVKAANDQLQRSILLSHEYHDAQQSSGSAAQRDRLAIDQDRVALAQATKGTLAHKQALVALHGDQLTYDNDLKTENVNTTNLIGTWKTAAAKDDDAVTALKKKVSATQTAIDAQKKLNATGPSGVRGVPSGTEIGFNKALGDSQSKLTTYTDRLRTAEERAAAAHVNEARALRDLPVLTGAYEVALGKLAATSQRVGKAVAIKYTSPTATANVAAAATGALQSGAPQKLVLKIIADSSNAKQAIAELNAVKVADKVGKVVAQVSGEQDVRDLGAAIGKVASSKTSKVDAHVTGTSDVNALGGAIGRVAPSTSAAVTANTYGTGGVLGLVGAIAQVTSKTANVTVNTYENRITSNSVAGPPTKHASGAGPGGAHRALIGEGGAPEWVIDPRVGSAWRTNGPMLADLSSTSYVIPTESSYAARGRSLLAGAARDLGIPAYKSGVGPAGTKVGGSVPLTVPKSYSAGGVSTDLASAREQAAKTNYDKRETSIHTTQKAITAAEKALKGKKGKSLTAAQGKLHDLRAKLGGLQSTENGLERTWLQAKADLAALNQVNAQIARLDTMQKTDATKMANAAAKHDPKAYRVAQSDRETLLGKLRTLYEAAEKYSPKASQLKANLESSIADNATDKLAANVGYQSTQPTPADTPVPTLSDFIAADKSKGGLADQLSALTFNLARDNATPGADTTADTNALNAFYTGLIGGGKLSQSQATEAYNDISNPLTAAAGLTDDQQAQLAQLTANGGYVQQAKAINDAYAKAAFGQADIDAGSGGGPSITINTLHPADPSTLRAIGSAATAGMGYQASRSNSRVRTGL